MIRAVVLGAAAGGGFPQWNSNAPGCRRARAGAARARSQASLAVSANEDDWFVLNASPDLRLQIEANEVLHPREGLRSSPIAGVVVTGGDVDAIAGLLHLRERHRFTVYAPAQVLGVIAANPIFGVLAPDCDRQMELPLDRRRDLDGTSRVSGLAVAQQVIKRVAIMIALGSNLPQPRFELVPRQQRAAPSLTCIPSYGSSSAAASVSRRARESSSRTGFELLM